MDMKKPSTNIPIKALESRKEFLNATRRLRRLAQDKGEKTPPKDVDFTVSAEIAHSGISIKGIIEKNDQNAFGRRIIAAHTMQDDINTNFKRTHEINPNGHQCPASNPQDILNQTKRPRIHGSDDLELNTQQKSCNEKPICQFSHNASGLPLQWLAEKNLENAQDRGNTSRSAFDASESPDVTPPASKSLDTTSFLQGAAWAMQLVRSNQFCLQNNMAMSSTQVPFFNTLGAAAVSTCPSMPLLSPALISMTPQLESQFPITNLSLPLPTLLQSNFIFPSDGSDSRSGISSESFVSLAKLEQGRGSSVSLPLAPTPALGLPTLTSPAFASLPITIFSPNQERAPIPSPPQWRS